MIYSSNKPFRDNDMFNESNSVIPYISIELARALTPSQRSELGAFLSTEAMRISKRTIAALNPEYTKREISHKFIEIHYGKELADGMREWEKTRTLPRESDDTGIKDVAPSQLNGKL